MSNAGEKVFSTRGRKTQRFTFTPPPPGEYEFKIRGPSVSIGCKPEPGSIPYLKVQLEAQNTGTEESGGRNKLVFHMLFVNTTPMGNGFVLTDKGGQVVDLVHAVGEEPDFPLVDHDAKVKVGGTKESPEYDMRTVEIIDPQALKQWLLDHDGVVVKGRSKLRKRDDGSEEAVIEYFIAEESSNDPFAEDAAEEPKKVTALKPTTNGTRTASKTSTTSGRAATSSKRR